MKKNTFIQGAFVATFSIILVKIIGILYVIPFHAIVGESSGELYGYAYNIYMIFLGISSAGLPFAISKLMGEYDALGYKEEKVKAYKIIKNFSIIISIILFIVLMVMAPNFARLMVGPKESITYIKEVTYVIRMISFAILIVPFLSITKGFLQGHKYITPGSISQIIEQVVRVLIILLGSYVAINVFKTNATIAVGISAFAAFVGGLFAYIYLAIVIKKNKLIVKNNKKSSVSTKEIIKKIIEYAIPFIITGISLSIYNFTDMVLIRRTLTDILNFDSNNVKIIVSIYSTWGTKLLAIVVSIAVGITTSLIPNIVQSYTKKDTEDLCKKINKSLQLILLVIVPATIFLSIMSNNVWNLFYGNSYYGTLIFKVYIFTALATSCSNITNNILQGMNKYKMVYLSTFIGLGLNLILDIPLMLIFDRIGLFPVYGASISTVISSLTSFVVSLKYLEKKENIKYNETIKMLPKFIASWIIFIIVLIFFKNIFNNIDNRAMQIPVLLISAFVSFGLYLLQHYYNRNLKKILGNIKLFKKKEDIKSDIY